MDKVEEFVINSIGDAIDRTCNNNRQDETISKMVHSFMTLTESERMEAFGMTLGILSKSFSDLAKVDGVTPQEFYDNFFSAAMEMFDGS